MNRTKKAVEQAFEGRATTLEAVINEHYDQIDEASGILPAWFVYRMMDDEWHFGLMLSNGTTIGISKILEVSQDAAGDIWLDAEMLPHGCGDQTSLKILTAPCEERRRVSINARHVMFAFEIAST